MEMTRLKRHEKNMSNEAEQKIDCDVILLRAMICMASSDKELEKREIEAVREIYRRLTSDEINTAEVGLVADAMSSPADILPELEKVHAVLSKDAKENIIRGTYLVLLADGLIAAEEQNTLHRIADALHMPEIHYQTVLEDLEISRSAHPRPSR